MAIASPTMRLDCFADPDELNPDSNKCAACPEQKRCEQEIITRMAEESDAAEAEAKEADLFGLAGAKLTNNFQRSFSSPTPLPRIPTAPAAPAPAPTTNFQGVEPTYAPAPQVPMACPGVAPVTPVPRMEGEEVWARLGKNVSLGALARALTEASLVAEDERRRPVGPWGRKDNK